MTRFSIALLFVGGCIRIETVVETEHASAPLIVFDAPIPQAPEEMPVYPLRPGDDDRAVFRKLGKNAEACQQSGLGDQFKSRRLKQSEPSRNYCRVDPSNGDFEVYPDFTRLSAGKSGALDRKDALKFASDVLVEPRSLRIESTRPKVHMQYVLKHERIKRNPSDGTARFARETRSVKEALVFTIMKRQVEGRDVDGPGSRLFVASDAEGAQGYLQSWRIAGEAKAMKAQRKPAEVRTEIERQLLSLKPHAPLHIRKIELIYYDGNAALLQPVYRFVVEASSTRQSLGLPEHFVGYVRYADTQEQVPELGVLQPERPAPNAAPRALDAEPPLLLGAYIARDHNPDWVNDARAFFGEIRASEFADRFIIKQFERMTPEQFTTASHRYVNSVDIALVEAHGAPNVFATLNDCCEPVRLSRSRFGRAASSDFGPGSEPGRLAHLVLHSCSVIASPDERPDWAEPWWEVFKGLRSVVGYRTAMYINDGAGAAFGRSLAAGSAVLPAWFNAVASLNAYARDPSLGFRCEGSQPMGRPAAISVCGEEDAVSPTTSQATDPATCLDAWWIGDAIETY